MKYLFLAVNYNSNFLIINWIKSIRKLTENPEIIIVDNFSTNDEIEIIKSLSLELDFILILSDNVGYGGGLNKGLIFIKEKYKSGIVFCGNLDIEYLNIPKELPKGNFVHIPHIIEPKRNNRNPFLTRFQKNLIPIYGFAAKKKSQILYIISISLNKIFSIVKSKIWAVHGSLFCFDYSLLKDFNDLPFNNDSFMYGEEYEFARFIEIKGFKLIPSKIKAFHHSHATTKKIKQKFIHYWAPSFLNFIDRHYKS